ncbi:uncharacterized protein C10orf95-like [Panicum virgatum]|uniref:uncharacterized protein C10orf95-like n=1 Tax=Panicum virgatum TaxID=38727 RepID=UPI0019D4FAC7|nr:uncharacterized protein C10orf95-like [Panicum virgatum]
MRSREGSSSPCSSGSAAIVARRRLSDRRSGSPLPIRAIILISAGRGAGRLPVATASAVVDPPVAEPPAACPPPVAASCAACRGPSSRRGLAAARSSPPSDPRRRPPPPPVVASLRPRASARLHSLPPARSPDHGRPPGVGCLSSSVLLLPPVGAPPGAAGHGHLRPAVRPSRISSSPLVACRPWQHVLCTACPSIRIVAQRPSALPGRVRAASSSVCWPPLRPPLVPSRGRSSPHLHQPPLVSRHPCHHPTLLPGCLLARASFCSRCCHAGPHFGLLPAGGPVEEGAQL